MKKWKTATSGVIAAALLTASPFFSPAAFAAGNQISVDVNGSPVSFPDAKPYISTAGRTMVPVRFVSETLGYQVQWNGQTQSVTIVKNQNDKVSFRVGSSTADVNGQAVQLDAPAANQSNRTYVPIRFVSEALGESVAWDGHDQLVYMEAAPASLSSKREITATATAYSLESGSRDSLGNPLHLGTVAVDPSVIPLGTKLYIEGYNFRGLPAGGMYAIASDTGGSIKGNKIDVYIPPGAGNAIDFGIQQVKVYILN